MKRYILLTAIGLLTQSCRDVNSGGTGGAPVKSFLDMTFGESGKVNSDFASGYDVINEMILQPDGKIIAAGTTGTPRAPKFMIMRYNVDGSVDSSFRGGKAIDFPKAAVPYSVFLDSAGRVVVAGASDGAMVVIRLKQDGSPDETFGNNGKLSATVGERSSAFCATLAADDSIVLGGFTVSGQKEEMAFVKYDKNGNSNAEFKGPRGSGKGKFSFSIGAGNSRIYAMKNRTEGLLAVGTRFNGSNYDFAIVKLKADGEQESSFGSDSQVTIDASPSGDDVLKSVLWLENGKIIVAGFSTQNSKEFNVLVYRLNADGSLDTSFGNGGKLKLPWNFLLNGGPLMSGFVKLSTDHENRIYIASEPNVDGRAVFGVARLTVDGQVDTSYGRDGLITTTWSEGNQSAAAHAIAIQPDGKAILGGYSTLNSNFNFALARYSP